MYIVHISKIPAERSRQTLRRASAGRSSLFIYIYYIVYVFSTYICIIVYIESIHR